VVTKVVTATVLAGCGDCLAQKRDGQQLDGKRLAAFSTFGGAYTGLFNHWWFNWLGSTFPGASFKAVAQKTLLQQGGLNPFVYLPLFFCTQGLLLGHDWECTMTRIQNDYTTTLKTVWCVWVPASLLQFMFVPTRMHVFYIATVSLGCVSPFPTLSLYHSKL
jgi:protein Mpv17